MPKTKEKKEKDKDGEKGKARASLTNVGTFLKAATKKSGRGSVGGEGAGGLDLADINEEEQDMKIPERGPRGTLSAGHIRDSLEDARQSVNASSMDRASSTDSATSRSNFKQASKKLSSSSDSNESVTGSNGSDPALLQHPPMAETMPDPTTSAVFTAARRSSRSSTSKAHLYSSQSIEDFFRFGTFACPWTVW